MQSGCESGDEGSGGANGRHAKLRADESERPKQGELDDEKSARFAEEASAEESNAGEAHHRRQAAVARLVELLDRPETVAGEDATVERVAAVERLVRLIHRFQTAVQNSSSSRAGNRLQHHLRVAA